MNNIKATDLLMKIYEDVKKIKETVMLQSFQYNLILKKLNDLELSNKTNRTNKTNVEENVNSFMIKSTESLPVGNFKAVETAPNVNSSFKSARSIVFKLGPLPMTTQRQFLNLSL